MQSFFRVSLAPLALACVCLSAAPATAAPATAAPATTALADPLASLTLDVPATKFVLKNGLTLIVHEDRSAPLVAVNIWYHVGSKDEPKGRSGFAHLFEHVMFEGSENSKAGFFKTTQEIGASDQNGTTGWDRTNYFETVPKAALDSILWLESDRMGHLLGVLDQAKLDKERAVVKNEKRGNENEPYGKAYALIVRGTTIPGHPYDHPTIGSVEDLDAASVDDVKAWFTTYYGPSNATLVLSGDITPAEAKAKVEKYFGDIPPGAPLSRPTRWVDRRTGTIRETAYDRVAQPKLYRVWNTAEYAAADTDYLQFVAGVLAGDNNSRLYKRLVIDERLATEVAAGVDNREIGGQFSIEVTLTPDADMGRVEGIVDEELKRLIANGPTPTELARVRTGAMAGLARAIESISTKASLLAESQTYLGSPDGWKAGFARSKNATPRDLQEAARRWLSDGDYVLRILPFGELAASGAAADRKTMPMPQSVAAAVFPTVERATLANGMKLVVARRPGTPVVSATIQVSTGVPRDYASVAAGTGGIAMSLLDDGTVKQTGAQLIDRLGALGATIQSGGGGETSTVSLSALKPALADSLALYADVVMNPAFRQADVDRIRAEVIADLVAARQDPDRAAGRVLRAAMFGAGSPYGQLTTEATLGNVGRDDVAAFHARWFHPGNATLIVVGDTSLAEIRPMIEKAFGAWRPGAVPPTIAPTASFPAKPVVYLIDRPGSEQTNVAVALIAPPRAGGDEVSREIMNMALGGSFTSRINMKLREEKGWTYGAGSGFGRGGKAARLFAINAAVQTDKTAESMAEIAAILKGVVADARLTADEVARAKDEMRSGLGSAWSTADGIAGYLADQTAAGLPNDHFPNYSATVARKSLEQIDSAATALIGGRALTWVVAGDRAKIEANIRALGLGELRVVDADGNASR